MAIKTVRMCATKYLGPTDTRGARVKATHLTTHRSVTLAWDHSLDVFDNHCAAAVSLFGRLPEFSTSVDGGGYIFGEDPARAYSDALTKFGIWEEGQRFAFVEAANAEDALDKAEAEYPRRAVDYNMSAGDEPFEIEWFAHADPKTDGVPSASRMVAVPSEDR